MQATYYSVRFAGGILGSFGGAVVYNKANWGWGLTFHQIALLNGVIPFCLVTPWLYWCVSMFIYVYIHMYTCIFLHDPPHEFLLQCYLNMLFVFYLPVYIHTYIYIYIYILVWSRSIASTISVMAPLPLCLRTL